MIHEAREAFEKSEQIKQKLTLLIKKLIKKEAIDNFTKQESFSVPSVPYIPIEEDVFFVSVFCQIGGHFEIELPVSILENEAETIEKLRSQRAPHTMF